MSDPARAARAKRLLEKHASELAAFRLARHEPPRVGPQVPAEPERKYPALQALAALRQDIHDEFSRSQLELLEVKARLDADLAVLAASPAPAAPPPEPPASPAPAAGSPQAGPAGAAKTTAPGSAPDSGHEPAADSAYRGVPGIKYWLVGMLLVLLCAAALILLRPRAAVPASPPPSADGK